MKCNGQSCGFNTKPVYGVSFFKKGRCGIASRSQRICSETEKTLECIPEEGIREISIVPFIMNDNYSLNTTIEYHF